MSQIAMLGIPNVHLLALFIASFTLVYRKRALIPIYVYIFLFGAFVGFSPIGWIPYLYIWLPLWGMFMLAGRFEFRKAVKIPNRILAKLPEKFPKAIPLKIPLYMFLCALHGISFGAMWAPFWALFVGLSFQGMITWIIFGIPFDVAHAIGNFVAATMILPLTKLLKRLDALGNMA